MGMKAHFNAIQDRNAHNMFNGYTGLQKGMSLIIRAFIL